MRSPRSALVPVFAGFVLGVGVTMAFHRFSVREAQTPPARAAAPAEASAQAEVVRLKEQLDFSENQVRQLQAASSTAVQAPKPSLAPAAAPANSLPPFMEQAIKSQTQRMNDEKVLALKNRLQLTPDQEKRVRDWIAQQSKLTENITAKMMAGETVDPKEMAKQTAGLQPESKMLDEILTPEQKTAYEDMQVEEKDSRIEMSATVELNQMAPLLGLDEAQKDAFFQAMVSAERELDTPEGRKKFTPPGDDKDPLRYFQAREAAKLEAAKSVLSAEQWDVYRQRVTSQGEAQRTMMKAFLPKTAP